MRKHTKEFKSSISTFGRELDSKITVLGTELILEKEDLFSITPITNSTLLKTVMKEVDFESKKQIGIGQEVNVKSGVKVNGEYEYIDYGNYSVYKSEYKAETDTYSHICYDKMLKTMIDYTPLDITYPINLREYINAIATKCGLEFADKNSAFANYNTSINEDHFSNGNYTFRDVLDYIAQLVGGWLCINDNDELEIRYPELAKNYDKVSGENVSFISNVEDEINTIIVDGKSTQATRSGKNLFDINKQYKVGQSFTYNGITITYNENGYITLNGTASANGDINIVPNDYTITLDKDIYLCFEALSGSVNIPSRGVSVQAINKSGDSIWKYKANANNPIMKVPYSDIASIKWIRVTLTPGLSFNNYKFRFWVSTENNLDYEPYGVMPSPDYPSEIESVGTYFSFDEETGKYGIEVKNTGKNLLNIFENYTSGQSITSNGITYKINEDGTITANGTATANAVLDVGRNLTNEFKEGTYIASGCPLNGSSSTYQITLFKTSTETTTALGGDFGSGLIVSINETCYLWERIVIYKGQTVNNLVFKPMIRLSSIIDDTYEPYQSASLLFQLDQPLRSLPNGVKDELVIENGRAKIIKRIGKIVLDGSENWYMDKELTNTVRFYTSEILTNKAKNAQPILSNYFITATSVNNINNDDNESAYVLNTTQPAIRINKSIANTLTTFKNWLSTHNTQVDYELAEPQIIELGDSAIPYIDGINYMHISSNMDTTFSLVYPHKTISGNTYDYTEFNPPGVKQTGTIKSYNAITGIGTLMSQYPFMYTPMQGDSYAVISNIYNVSGFSYLYNTPYNTVNSLYTHGYTATWATPDGLCVLPDDFNITLQFSPDGNFFYDQNGVYQEVVNLITTETDDANNEGEFTIKIDKNKLIFVQNPDISLELPFYTNTTQVFVLSSASVAQINNDYVWDDTATWTDTYTWVEGGTSLERVCNHWWKVQITNTGIKIEEIFPTT